MPGPALMQISQRRLENRRNRPQARREPEPGWTPGEDSERSMRSILGRFSAANWCDRTLVVYLRTVVRVLQSFARRERPRREE